MLLDEATSAVDANTEAHIKESVRNSEKTTLLIAYVFFFYRLVSSQSLVMLIIQLFICRHRLSSITYADRIIVLGKGEDGCGVFVEEGTHQGLLARDGVYARMWENSTGEKNIDQILDGGASGMSLPNNGTMRRRGGGMH
jgi:ABC-type multidrug transport system fused ATPase/permease subunit